MLTEHFLDREKGSQTRNLSVYLYLHQLFRSFSGGLVSGEVYQVKPTLTLINSHAHFHAQIGIHHSGRECGLRPNVTPSLTLCTQV